MSSSEKPFKPGEPGASDDSSAPEPIQQAPKVDVGNLISRAPPPGKPVRGVGGHRRRDSPVVFGPINWKFWTLKDEVAVWQAAALSLGIDPYAIHKHEEYWGQHNLAIERRWFESDAQYREFSQRRELVDTFNRSLDGTVRTNYLLGGLTTLSGFARWAVADGLEVPREIDAMTVAAAQSTEGIAAGQDPDSMPQDTNVKFAALFDPVGTAALEKMFPTSPHGSSASKWPNWAERAASNGLSAARTGRAMFNPLLAAQWWMTRNPLGWDWARCKRRLASNLPERSKDSQHLFAEENE